MSKNHLKILTVLILSFALSFVMSKTIFLANTPRVSPKFAQIIKNLPKELSDTSKNFFAQISKIINPTNTTNKTQDFFSILPQTNIPKDINLKPISKGVYAGEEKKSNIKYIKIEKGKRVEVREYVIKQRNGQDKIIKVLIPIN